MLLRRRWRRGYQGGDGRTKYRILEWKLADTLAILVMLALAGLLFILKNE